MSNLVIVESPAKAKTIKKYLGSDYDVLATMGHIRDLPEKRLSVDVKKNFEPKYDIIKGKEDIVKELKSAASNSDMVYLATDPDREGEAISWHLAYVLGLDINDSNRVTFNEITRTGVQNGMASPRAIDINLVNAQQARRILDRLVGYKLSPFIAQKIRRGLSAGRVQSVAMRIIVDREDEIRKFVPEESWTIDAKFIPKGSTRQLVAQLYGGKDGKKLKIATKEQADAILKELEDAKYSVASIKKGRKKKQPPPPFITSTMQQEASSKLGFQARRTMKAAQELYEGVDIAGMGAIGLITYMRTDSLRISNDAINDAKSYILGRWGEKYLPEKTRYYKSRANAQDGHEAIRPTTISLTPDKVKGSLSPDQYKLYKLIWERFLSCQMANCVLSTTKAEITGGDYIFTASGHTVAFDGYTVIYTESKSDEESNSMLPPLEEGMPLKKKSIEGVQHFTQPPSRYTEASLIKALEENGIGRPSTYATTISTITSREYVRRESKKLIPTEVGEVSTKLMKERFPKIVNVKFTAQVEDELDSIQNGNVEWTDVLHDFYDDFEETLKKAKDDMQGVKIELEEDKTDLVCELCGKPMVIKTGRFGRFIACSGYPECKNTKKLVKETGAACPLCGDMLIERRGKKKGRVFYGCNAFPKCTFASWDPPVLDEVCPKCGKTLFKKSGKGAKIYCVTEGCGYEKKVTKKGEEE